MKKQKNHMQIGVTLIEMIVVVVLVGIVTTMSAPYLLGQREKRLLTTERDKLMSFMKEAQNKAMIAEDGYGYTVVEVNPGNYQICQTGGPLCMERQISLSNSLMILWPGDVEFEKLTGGILSSVVVGMSTNNFETDFSISAPGVFEMGVVNKL
jgi:prepilin-type N-terminal cleavage/methylation domain-containing protein